MLRAFARRLLGSTRLAQEIDDVVQDTFTRALRGAATYDPERALEPWLRGICVRVAADRQRTLAGERAAGEGVGRASTGGERARGGRSGGEELEPESVLDPRAERPIAALDARDELTRRLAALPAADRDLLLAFHRDGRSIADLADEIGAPEGTVKSRLSRARRTLADLARAREEDRR
ncbi:ECF RNA polymerase sigma factor SigW [Planctomycetes bacterium Pla163]|uniref:ECF RNA polymerase sigma factor SigW n=2 Tax=Rohdeia mirabilis TaxID=2528008 RepID=A0A518D4W1_9BACT|nr:ECF RNA polymerase sigma factor SigW [Planctomycetes bacterium Pla163]